MKRTTRREFLKHSAAGGLALGLPSLILGGDTASGGGEVRVAVVGLGGLKIPGSVGGRGRQLIDSLRKVPEAKIVALCDVDQAILDQAVQSFKERNEKVAAYHDLRRVFDDKSVDAVFLALPNHWHALAMIWACQAGKHVYTEKPFSWSLWEGRQMVAAARKHNRIVQVGTQSRASTVLREAFPRLRSELGPIRCGHAIIYRAREAMAKAAEPTPVPASVDYDLWCGPIARGPIPRRELHYHWHWFWMTGNGEIGNNGPHTIDVCRWGMGQDGLPPRAISLGGRFGFDDEGETPNTQIAILDYQPAPMICEVRNYYAPKKPETVGKFRGRSGGVVIDCEGGSFAGDSLGGAFFDRQGKKMAEIVDKRKPHELEIAQVANFIAAVRSRKQSDLFAEAIEGYRSVAGIHMANTSYRLGRETPPDTIRETIRGNKEYLDAFERCREYLAATGIDLNVKRAVSGPWVTLDPKTEQFVGEFAERANRLSRREYRKPFVVPSLV